MSTPCHKPGGRCFSPVPPELGKLRWLFEVHTGPGVDGGNPHHTGGFKCVPGSQTKQVRREPHLALRRSSTCQKFVIGGRPWFKDVYTSLASVLADMCVCHLHSGSGSQDLKTYASFSRNKRMVCTGKRSDPNRNTGRHFRGAARASFGFTNMATKVYAGRTLFLLKLGSRLDIIEYF